MQVNVRVDATGRHVSAFGVDDLRVAVGRGGEGEPDGADDPGFDTDGEPGL